MNGSPVPDHLQQRRPAHRDASTPPNPAISICRSSIPAPGPATSSDLIALVNGTPPTPVVNPQDAARFLEQATFGATDADIHNVSMNGYQAWLNQQFAMPPTPQEPAVEQALIINNPPCAASDVNCNAALFVQNYQGEIYVQDAFWQQALAGSDQLRQRVQYALHRNLRHLVE